MTSNKLKEKYIAEKQAAQKVRQNKTSNWLKNEELYNGVQQPTLLTRSNLHIPKVFEGVNMVAARIGAIPEVDYETKPEGDENAADIMKGLWQYDSKKSRLKYLANLSRVEAGIYGRAIFKLIPSNEGMTWDLIDTMAFLISPIALTTTDAQFCGQDFIYKTIDQLEAEADAFGYDPKVLKKVSKVSAEKLAETSDEASKRNSRLSALGFTNVTELGSKVVKITEWYTHVDGEKHIQTWVNDEHMLRDIKLSEIGLEDWPFESYATFPRAVTFWVPSVADVLRDPNLALDTIANQIIDNNTYRNFGMLFVDSASGLKQSSIIPRPLGVTSVTVPMGKRIQDSIYKYEPAEIGSAMNIYQLINNTAESAAGISAPSISNRGKKTVSELAKEMAMVEQMSNSMRDSYLICFEAMAQRYADFISKKLTTPRKVKIMGQKPTTLDGVTSKNFENVDFIANVTASEFAKENKAIKQKARMAFFDRLKDDPQVNQLELKRLLAKESDITGSEQERLFTLDQPMQSQPGQDGQPGAVDIPVNAENPQLSEAGQITQANLGR